MRYLDLNEKELIYDALAYYATHALQNSTDHHKDFVRKNAHTIFDKLSNETEIVAVVAESKDDTPKPLASSPKESKAQNHRTKPDTIPQIVPRPEDMSQDQWEKLINMGLTDLEQYPFVD